MSDHLDPVLTADELGDRFARWALATYRKRGEPTKHARKIRRAVELLRYSGLGQVAPEAFGPKRLARFQAWLAADPHRRWSRPTINELTRAVAEAFRWGAAEELTPPGLYDALRMVRPLARGRAPADGVPPPREGGRVRAADLGHIEALAKAAPPMIGAMIRVQTLTGMRPLELVTMRAELIHPTPVEGVRAYLVAGEGNKLDHLDLDRTVWLGPKALTILEAWLPDDPTEPVWSPRRAEAIRNAAKREARETPRWGGVHDPDERRRRRGSPAKLGAAYTTTSYGRALARLSDRLFDPRGERVAAGDTSHRITPNRLRHTAATELTRVEGLEVAKIMLGHRDLSTTLRYAELSKLRAAEVARDLG